MTSKSLTVRNVADRLGVDQRKVTGWRRGERGPSLAEAKRLAGLLDEPGVMRWWDWPNGIDPDAVDPIDGLPSSSSLADGAGAEDGSADHDGAEGGISGAVDGSALTVTASQTLEGRRRGHRRLVLAAAGVLVVAAVLVATGWLIARAFVGPVDPRVIASSPVRPASAPRSSSTADPLEQGPTVTIGTLSCGGVVESPEVPTLTETQGSLGAQTFSDPRQLCGGGAKVQPFEKVRVVCRLKSPEPSSVVPDGYWYLLASGDGRGRFAAANTFLNGDPLGAGNRTNTDSSVPRCNVDG